jgi:hypothetical protein
VSQAVSSGAASGIVLMISHGRQTVWGIAFWRKGGGGAVAVRSSNNFAAEIRALAGGGGHAAREALVRALLDERPRVAREARRALTAGGFVVSRERLLDLYCTTNQRHTRTQVLALLARGGRGASMVSLLDAALVSDGAMLALVCQHLGRWLDGWAPLPDRSVRQLAGAFREAEEVLPVALAERLRVYLRELRGTAPTAPVGTERVLPAGDYRRRGSFLRGRTVRRSYEMVPGWVARVRGVLRF